MHITPFVYYFHVRFLMYPHKTAPEKRQDRDCMPPFLNEKTDGGIGSEQVDKLVTDNRRRLGILKREPAEGNVPLQIPQ